MSEHDQDRDIQRLLEAAGPRENPPEAMRSRVHENVLAAWEDMPQRKASDRQRFMPRQWAIAASVFVAFVAGLVFFNQDVQPPLEWAAELGRTSGTFTVSQTQPDGLIGDKVLVATQTDGQVELRLAGGSKMQLDHDTRVTVLSGDSVALFEGRLYVDGGVGSVRGQSSVRIVTPHSVITDIGTLFEVTVTGEQWAVGMREGEVKVEMDNREYAAHVVDGRGDRLQFINNDLIEKSTIATTGAQWNWTQALREPFKLSGAKIFNYLEWAARDSGRTLEMSGIVAQQAKQRDFAATRPDFVAGSDRKAITDALIVTDFTLRESAEHKLEVVFRD